MKNYNDMLTIIKKNMLTIIISIGLALHMFYNILIYYDHIMLGTLVFICFAIFVYMIIKIYKKNK